ncbi:metallophosphoesterase family protein [Salirhabdus sp. Marseille-P4669]|uniref:metallophosphoesterase family protein n=1 Tax=Salirhabdus sp. Marseille-P4669 TaxID=2042310 RepID=UPI000C7A2233|nr:metallophosphoesterase family protein [Salirhabdus sp. Marseille-P4669]
MKIVVTGDTHIPKKSKPLPSVLLKECETADLILHTGDWQSLDVYETLAAYANVIGVYGNVDGEDVQKLFQAREIVEVEGYKLGLFHGHGDKKTTEKRALEAFEGKEVDAIIFGHSHIPMMRYLKKVLLFNPGSPTDKRALPYYSYGILTIGDCIKGEIVFFKEKE